MTASSLSVDRVLRSVMLMHHTPSPGDTDIIDRVINGNNPSLRLYARNVAVRLMKETSIEKINPESVLRIFQSLGNHFPADKEVADYIDQLERRRRHMGRRREESPPPKKLSSPKHHGMASILGKLKQRQNMSPNIPSTPNSYLFEDLIRDFSPKAKLGSNKGINIPKRTTPTVVIPPPLSPGRILLSDSSDESSESSRCVSTSAVISRPFSRSSNISIEDEYDMARAFKVRKWWSKWRRFVLSQERVMEGLKKMAKFFSLMKKKEFFQKLKIYWEWKLVENERQKIRIERLNSAISLRVLIESWDNWRTQFSSQISKRRNQVGGIGRIVDIVVTAVDRRFRESFFCIGVHAESIIVRQYEQTKGARILKKLFRKYLGKFFGILKTSSSNVHLYRFCGVVKLVPIVQRMADKNLRMGLKKIEQKFVQIKYIPKFVREIEHLQVRVFREFFATLRGHARHATRIESGIKSIHRRHLAYGFRAIRSNLESYRSQIRTTILAKFFNFLTLKTDINKRLFFHLIRSFHMSNDLESKLAVSEISQQNLTQVMDKLVNELALLKKENDRLQQQTNRYVKDADSLLVCKCFAEWRKYTRMISQQRKAAKWISTISNRIYSRNTKIWYDYDKSRIIRGRRMEAFILRIVGSLSSFLCRKSLGPTFTLLRLRENVVQFPGAIDRMKQSTLRSTFTRLRVLFSQSRKIKRCVALVQRNLLREAFNAVRENYWKMEILLSYAEIDRMMETCQGKLEAYDECMRKVQRREDTSNINLYFISWRNGFMERRRKIERMTVIVSKFYLRIVMKRLSRLRDKSTESCTALSRLIGAKISQSQIQCFFVLWRNWKEEERLSLTQTHTAELEEHSRVAKELADAATEIEADYEKLEQNHRALIDRNKRLEEELREALVELKRGSRENEMLILRLNESQSAELKLRDQVNDSRRILDEHEQYRRLADQQRIEIEKLLSRVGEHGKLTNSIAFYKNKCMLQSEQISALQLKLRESTTSPILSSSMNRRTSGVMFPSPVHENSQDFSTIPSRRPRSSISDYTPTGEESSRRHRSYLDERRRY